jgi:quercetin dioxygenase-like cupin family protein
VQVTRIADASSYEAPGHFGMSALRLQGYDRSDSPAFWVGLSHLLPGGGAQRSASSLDRVYVVLDGAVTLTTDDDEVVLTRLDSVYVAGGESRAVSNHTTLPASMLVIMPYPEDPR